MKIQLRTKKGSKMRSLNKIPGVLYGKGIESTSISVDALDFTKKYYEKGTSTTFEVSLDGKKHLVYIKEVQTFPCHQNQPCHFDLVKVSKDDTMVSKIRVTFMNKEAVAKRGLILNGVSDVVEIEYDVGKGVSILNIDVEALEDNDVLYVKDVILPKGIKMLSNLEDVVVSCSRPKEEFVEEDEEAEEIIEVESIKQSNE